MQERPIEFTPQATLGPKVTLKVEQALAAAQAADEAFRGNPDAQAAQQRNIKNRSDWLAWLASRAVEA